MKPLPTAQHGRHPQEPFWLMDNVSSRGPDFTVATRSDRDQVTPALACGATVAQLTHGNPGPQQCWHRGAKGWCPEGETDLVQLGCAAPRKGIAPTKPIALPGTGGVGRGRHLAAGKDGEMVAGRYRQRPLARGLVTGISVAGPVPRDTQPSRAPW